MSDPVNTEKYWEDRLEQYKDNLPFAIYCTSPGLYEEMVAKHVKELEPYRKMKVLDAGCGYGRMSEHFSNYTGVDFVHAFIDKAKELYPSKKFKVANLKKLPFKDKEFHVAFCIMVKGNVMQNLGKKEWEDMERELKRVAYQLIILES